MPQSVYTKILDLLTELSREGAPQDLFQFADAIHNKQIESFVIWRPGADPNAPPVKSYCSVQSIRRLLRFAAELGLIEIGADRQCGLTGYGRNAVQGDNYPRVLSLHLTMYLKEKAGVSYSEIKDAITAIRRPEVAFFDTIYEKLRSERELKIGEERLHTVLYLLERCGMLASLTKKIYFAPEVQPWAA